MNRNETVIDAEFEAFDDELKRIMKGRYEDKSELFTPEAQDQRRHNREEFTMKITAFMFALCVSMIYMNKMGVVPDALVIFGVAACAAVAGYNVGVCICHNKGWRGA